MNLNYSGKIVRYDVSIIGLNRLFDSIAQNGSIEPSVLHFGCNTKAFNQNALFKAFGAVLNDKETIVCGSGCQFNTFNVLSNMCKPMVLVVDPRHLLKNRRSLSTNSIHEFTLSLAYLYDKVCMLDEHICEEIDTTYFDPMFSYDNSSLAEETVVVIPSKNISSVESIVDEIRLQYADIRIVVLINRSEENASAMVNTCRKLGVERSTYVGKFNYAKIHNDRSIYGNKKYAILLNDDVVIAGDILELVRPYTVDERVGVIGSKLYYPDNTIQHAGVVVERNSVRHIGRKKQDSISYDEFLFLDAVTFAYSSFKLEAFDKIGGFDEKFPYDLNDIDFCMRCKKAGYRTLYNPNSIAIHYESMTRKYDHYSGKEDFAYFKEKHKLG